MASRLSDEHQGTGSVHAGNMQVPVLMQRSILTFWTQVALMINQAKQIRTVHAFKLAVLTLSHHDLGH